MFFPRTLLFLSLGVGGFVLSASAQGPITVPLAASAGNAPAQKVAYLLDPKHNPAPTEPFALWPGLPSLKDLSPQAARLFVPTPASTYSLPALIPSVVPETGNGQNQLTVMVTSPTPDLNIGEGTPFGAVYSEIQWLGQPNEPCEVSATMWRFKDTDEVPEPFAQMLKNWDGKTRLVQEVDREIIWKIVITSNYRVGSPKYRLTPSLPLDMEFHSTLASEHKNPALPQDHVRVTATRTLRKGERGITVQSEMAALVESPGELWESVLVPKFSAGKELLVLLPENHEHDKVKATFLQFHIFVPGRG